MFLISANLGKPLVWKNRGLYSKERMINDLHIELYLLCFNESRMIRHTLNHYSKFCSKITIFDNDSTDDSVAIAESFDHPIEIKRLDTGGEHREDILRQTRNSCWKGSTADYVIVCDMDEFLYDEHLLEKFTSSQRKKTLLCPLFWVTI